MYVPGYYADQLSMAQEVRGNTTIRFKNESRGFHLNNLSYAGPIVMGLGGEYFFGERVYDVSGNRRTYELSWILSMFRIPR